MLDTIYLAINKINNILKKPVRSNESDKPNKPVKPNESEHWFKITFKFIIKNYIILSTIPILLGGVHQMLQLGIVGWRYLRFFSATQLLIDGLLLLIVIIIIVVIVIGFFGFNFAFNHTIYSIGHMDSPEGSDMGIVGTANGFATAIIFIGFLIYADAIPTFFNFIKLGFNGSFSNAINQYDLSPEFAALSSFLLFILLGNYAVYKNNKYRNRFSEMLSLFMWIPIAYFLAQSIPSTMKQDIQIFSGLEQVGNYQKYHDKLISEYPNYTDSKMLYYNDKFIFTELSSSIDKTIIITKMDEFLGLTD